MSSIEFRVRWRRDFHSSDQTRIYQSRKAAERRALFVEGRMAEATGDDPEALACGRCDCPTVGDDFAYGCKDVTNAENWERLGRDIPRLVDGPHIEVRDVGPWRSE